MNPPANSSESESIKILIVDDRPDNLTVLEAALKDTSYTLVQALSGYEALHLARLDDFAVILLDVQMPGLDGFETAQALRKHERTRLTPIIFITAINRSDSYEALGYIVGAVDFLFKPINVDILRAKIAVFAELHGKSLEIQRQAELLKTSALRDQENQLLKEAVKARDEFLSMASHELKTPITPLNLQIQTFLQMYRDGSVNKVPMPRLIRLLEISEGQVARLSRLVGELVDVSRFKVGNVELFRDQVDLHDMFETILSSFSEEFKRLNIEVRINGGQPVTGHWDRFRIEQIIINLVTNAIKYGKGKPIDIYIGQNGRTAIFSVTDYGIGIEPVNQERIFQRFERAVSSRHYGGLGLGLYIAGHIAELHGGRIWVESNPGEGSKFTVELPIQSLNS